jgi:hypothetical protein
VPDGATAGGRRVTEAGIPKFLDRTGSSPEHLALQSLALRGDRRRGTRRAATVRGDGTHDQSFH